MWSEPEKFIRHQYRTMVGFVRELIRFQYSEIGHLTKLQQELKQMEEQVRVKESSERTPSSFDRRTPVEVAMTEAIEEAQRKIDQKVREAKARQSTPTPAKKRAGAGSALSVHSDGDDDFSSGRSPTVPKTSSRIPTNAPHQDEQDEDEPEEDVPWQGNSGAQAKGSGAEQVILKMQTFVPVGSISLFFGKNTVMKSRSNGWDISSASETKPIGITR